jgi:hypothetical protein
MANGEWGMGNGEWRMGAVVAVSTDGRQEHIGRSTSAGLLAMAEQH